MIRKNLCSRKFPAIWYLTIRNIYLKINFSLIVPPLAFSFDVGFSTVTLSGVTLSGVTVDTAGVDHVFCFLGFHSHDLQTSLNMSVLHNYVLLSVVETCSSNSLVRAIFAFFRPL